MTRRYRSIWYIERDGIPVAATMQEAAASHRAHVADERAGLYRVSTVFLDIDHNVYDDGPPILYETMLFGDGPDDNWCQRYVTRTEAAAGHAAVIASLLATGRPEGSPA